ncbi:MAG: hypothetical protein Q9N26_08560 [Aquificota bacterium]|nr:hypothetical protein [Aquificota bacterium]
MRKFLFNLFTNTLRVVFGAVVVASLIILFLVFLDFSRVEPHLYPLQLIKREPYRVGEGVWLGGYFLNEEFVRFLKRHRIRTVVTLLDPDMYHERSLISEEKKVLRRHGIRVVVVPLKPFYRDPKRISRIRSIIRRGRAVYIHSYLGRVRVKYVEEAIRGE